LAWSDTKTRYASGGLLAIRIQTLESLSQQQKNSVIREIRAKKQYVSAKMEM